MRFFWLLPTTLFASLAVKARQGSQMWIPLGAAALCALCFAIHREHHQGAHLAQQVEE